MLVRVACTTQAGACFGHERGGAAKIELRVVGNQKCRQAAGIDPACDIEVDARDITFRWPAERYPLPALRQTLQQGIHFSSKHALGPVPGAIDPEDPGRRALFAGDQFMQHGQYRRDADTRTPEHHRAVVLAQHEAATGRADAQHVANLHGGMHVSAAFTVLSLDRDPVPAIAGLIRERIAAQQRLFGQGAGKAQHHKLAASRSGQRRSIDGFKNQRADRDALLLHGTNAHIAKTDPHGGGAAASASPAFPCTSGPAARSAAKDAANPR